MVLNTDVMISGFVLGLVTGVSTTLINKMLSAFARWVSSW